MYPTTTQEFEERHGRLEDQPQGSYIVGHKAWYKETSETISALEEEARRAEIKEDQDYLMSLAKGNL